MSPFSFGCGCGCGSGSNRGNREVREVVREVVVIPCKYCGTLFPQTATFCPHCGARRTT
jgi:rubrerythrin